MSIDLPFAMVRPSPFSPNDCFNVLDFRTKGKDVTLCVMPNNLHRGDTVQKTKMDWIKDIQMFKSFCQNSQSSATLGNDKATQSLHKGIAEESYFRAREKVKEIDFEKHEKRLEGQLQKQSSLAMQAMMKEMKYEKLAIAEELNREKLTESNLLLDLQSEREKQNCVDRDLLSKMDQGTFYGMNQDWEQKMDKLRAQTMESVSSARKRIQERLDAIRKTFEERRNAMAKRIMEVRANTANEVMNENRVGSKGKCKPSTENDKKIEYCNENFEGREELKEDCMRNSVDFCYVCCENEFGGMYEDNRESCFGECTVESDDLWAFVSLDEASHAKPEPATADGPPAKYKTKLRLSKAPKK